jgi:uncharacterized protein
MLNIIELLISEFNLQSRQVENVLKLHNDGNTLPFIARYRKEMTGSLDENVLRDLLDRYEYLTELEERKKTILESIESQGKLTDELRKIIENITTKVELEDAYLPYKPKRRTKATIAREKGLEPLADIIKNANNIDSPKIDLLKEAEKFVNEKLEVNSADDALKGASHIIAEEISEVADYRKWVRDYLYKNASFTSVIKPEFEEGTTKYEIYREYSAPVKDISPHNMLALRRGENEGILTLDLDFDEEAILSYLNNKTILTVFNDLRDFLKDCVKDSFKRLMKFSIIGELRLDAKQNADEKSIDVFEANLRQMLLASPAGMKPTLAIDPGFRTGCKTVVLDKTGKYLDFKAIFPFGSDSQIKDAADYVSKAIKKHKIELIAIGNATAGRETEQFIRNVLNENEFESKPVAVLVNEAGASVYSAGKVANEEFPELDLTVRGAISIGRRLMDPLAELVKIEPKSIGVGQYQHDVDQKLLKKKLEQTVECCVNYVGVDLNTASKELLTYVSGVSSALAKSIIDYRNTNGIFESRDELTKIPKFGPKTFEQAAGFLRIRESKNVLDNTAVHPESYYIVEKFANDLKMNISDLTKNAYRLKELNIKKYVDDRVGEPTLKDIIAELEKPGRDPRDEFKYAEFSDSIKTISDLKTGMILEGVVTNITNFGAFVDIGVKENGLVHISEMANHYVKDPTKILKVGQIIKVKIVDINESLGRIQLSIKRLKEFVPVIKKKKKMTLEDLKKKFGD